MLGARRTSYRAVVASVIVVALVASSLIVEVGLGGAEPEPREARTLDALPAEPAPERQPSAPDTDFTDPPPTETDEEASSFDPERSTVAERGESHTVYANPDGTRTIRSHNGPVNFRDADGKWRPIDPTLVSDGAGGYRNAAGPVRFSFDPDTDDADPVRISGGGWSLGFGLQGAARGKQAEAQDRKLTYREVDDDVDLEYHSTNAELKELIVLSTPPAQGTESRFVFPLTLEGLRAHQDDSGIGFTDAAGELVARIPPGSMWDSSDGGEGASVPVTIDLRTPATGPVLEVSADAAWLDDPARIYPVFIDPTVQALATRDTYVRFASPNTNYEGEIRAHVSENHRTFMKFTNFADIIGNDALVSATWNGYFELSDSATATKYYLRPVATNWSPSTITWNNQPGLRAGFREGSARAGEWRSLPVTSFVQNWLDGTWGNFGLAVDADPGVPKKSLATFEHPELCAGCGSPAAYLDITYSPSRVELLEPADEATVFTQTPTLGIGPAAGHTGYEGVQFWYRVQTGDLAEANTAPGQVIDSGWTDAWEWQVPEGSLQDGVTYSWTVFTKDAGGVWQSGWQSFTVDLHPYTSSDSFGPADVDLLTGGLSVGGGSHSYPTVGGAIGVSLNYDSFAADVHGLRGEYFEDANQNGLFDDTAGQVTRVDTMLKFDWDKYSPYPSIPVDHFLARWTGQVSVPTSGAWSFGAASDDGVRIWIDDQLVLDRWFTQSYGAPNYGTSVGLTAGEPVSILVEYFEATGTDARFSLTVQGPDGRYQDVVVPADWLSPDDPGEVPDGWSLHTGAGTAYFVSARVTDDAVTLVGASGDTYEFKRDGSGFTPPDGEEGVLAVDAATGNLTFHDIDGTDYVFRPDGTLASATTVADDVESAAPQYVWSGSHARVTTIRDPLTSREFTLTYGGSGGCPSPPASGFDADAPEGMICSITSWDGEATSIFYASGLLARIENPGDVVTDFGYTDGRLDRVRDPLAADAIAAGVRDDTDETRTLISYDGVGRIASIEGPAPTPGAARPRHTYDYGEGTSSVDVAGFGGLDSQRERVVTFDADGRVTGETDPASGTTSYEWDGWDLLSVTDPAGRKSTTIFDELGQPTDSYGPAPASWFGDDRKPLPAYVDQMPHATAKYDEGIESLSVDYWTNLSLQGDPHCHDTGVGHPEGAISADWGDAAPSCLLPAANNWSGRYTGEVLLSEAGDYTFRAYADGGVRLWIDDAPVIDAWEDTTGWKPDGVFGNDEAGSYRRIRLEYAETTGDAHLELHWVKPGSSAQALITGSDLIPGFGYPTSETVEDAHAGSLTTSTNYDNPHTGQTTAVTQDPGGLELTTLATYETPGAGYGRHVSRTLPAGNTWTYDYYAPTETLAVPPCGIDPGTLQAGFPKSRTGPDPDGAGPEVARVELTAYDDIGRAVATKVASSDWACTSFDDRGRPTMQTFPAHGTEPGRTVTVDHAVGGNPLVSSVTDPAGTITSEIDLLGRVVSYTDVWDQTTTSTYDQTGRLTTSVGPSGTHEYVVDGAGRLITQKLDGEELAIPTYNAIGEVTRVDYPDGPGQAGNGTALSSIGRDDLGRTTALTWQAADGSTLVSDEVTRSQSGRIVDQSVDGVDPHTGQNYLYDAAGRLVEAHVPGRTVSYAFASSGGCGASPSAGQNTNRTSMTIASGPSETYCYDLADRLTSTSVPAFHAIAYDARGNTTTLGDQQLIYDGADRHLETTDDLDTVTYTRDATDRIVARSSTVVAEVEFRAATSADNGDLGGSSLTIPRPSGVEAGDLMLLHVAVDGSLAALTPPSGFTLVREATNGGLRGAVYRKLAGAAEPADYTVALSVPAQASGGIGAWSGVDAAAPIEASSQATADATSVTVPSIAASERGRLVGLFAHKGADVDPPGGMTERWEAATPNAAPSLQATSQTADEPVTSTGPTGARAASSPNAGWWVGVLASLRPKTLSSATGYGFTSGGDSPSLSLDTQGQVIERTLSLPGGALLTTRDAGDVWSYSNIHGDVVATANASGAKQGPTLHYDPYGEALTETPDNSAGSFDFGWLGRDQRPVEGTAGHETVQMGRRPYVPTIGRFLEADPIEAGSANDYDYVAADPLNWLDLNGEVMEVNIPETGPHKSRYGCKLSYIGGSHIHWRSGGGIGVKVRLKCAFNPGYMSIRLTMQRMRGWSWIEIMNPVFSDHNYDPTVSEISVMSWSTRCAKGRHRYRVRIQAWVGVGGAPKSADYADYYSRWQKITCSAERAKWRA